MLGATANLGLLDVAGAREWIDVLERARRPVERSVPYYLVTSQAYYLQGRYREGLARVREGRQVLAAHPDDDWSMLVAADVWMSVHLGDIEGAERAVAAFGAVFRETRDPGNRYMAGMLDLALDRLRGRVDDEALVARMDALGGAVEAALGDLGRAERHAQECLLLSHLAPDRSAAVLRRADASNVFLGGCRLRQAERLLAGGEAAAAADEFRRALTDILWARFVYAEYVPAALLGLARARQALGRREEARAGYQVLLTNYARADRRVPEVEAAMEALGGLP
jgi:tetratricopeptide (TPR) repeat protein